MKNTKRSVSKLWSAVKIMSGVLVCSACLFASSFESLAAEGKVKPTSAKIRSEANTSSEALASVKSGDELTIKAKTTGADGYVWYQVFVDADTLGFIRSDLIEADGTVPEMQASSSQTDGSNSDNSTQTEVQNVQVTSTDVEQMPNQSATVTGGDVNVRASASTSAAKVTTAKNGSAITVTGKATGTDGKVWYQVSFIADGNEVAGFIRSDYVELGEIIEETPEQEEVVQETEPVEEQTQQPTESKVYDTVLETKEDGTQEWYLYDYGSGLKYSIPDLMAVTKNNTEVDGVLEKQLNQQKIVIIVLVVLVVILVLGVTLLFFKLHEGESEDDEDDEKFEEMLTRKRREERPTSQPARRPAAQADRPQRRPAQEGQVRPKQATKPVRTADGEPVRRPNGQTGNPVARQPQGNSTGVQRQAAPKPRPTAPKMPEKEVTYEEEPKLDMKKQNGQWRSKNFLADDDEFEFEFLNMDDPNRL